MSKKMTYISLFSSAGVGCYGFKIQGFDCIATNELIERRLNIQKLNNKCKYESGYICGDITKKHIKDKLFREIVFWKKRESLKDVDVVIATPPCQGMSVANHKKTSNEIIRNSLVVESIILIENIKPKYFVFENVPLFMKTICTDVNGINLPISKTISKHLDKYYKIRSEVINFKNHGANSSRSRTIVIGVRNDINKNPLAFFPSESKPKTLKSTIGELKSLKKFYEFDPNDIYHFFRGYPSYMRCWISNTKQGHSAFENKGELNVPYHFVDGKRVKNINKSGDKYTRLRWTDIGPCIHTRNDQLASQNTIHPADDRVFSIRELMILMNIPKEFKWTDKDLKTLNKLSHEEKIRFMKKNEINIRQSIGEAVPTIIFEKIARNIKNA